MSQIIIQGLRSRKLITQGYGVGAVTLVVTPYAPVALANGTITITASAPSDWSTSFGTLDVAGDNLSADWTAPNHAGTGTLTVAEIANPGNRREVHLRSLAGLLSPDIIGRGRAGRGGVGRRLRVGGGYGGSGGIAPPVDLLLDLVADWELTANPNDSAINALNLTNNAGVTFGSNGAVIDGDPIPPDPPYQQCLYHAKNALFSPGSESFLITGFFTIDDNSTSWSMMTYYDQDDAFEWTLEYGGGVDNTLVFGTTDADYDDYFVNPVFSPVVGTKFFVAAWRNAGEQTINIQVHNGAIATETNVPAVIAAANPLFGIGGLPNIISFVGKVKFARLWIGSNALTIAEDSDVMTWLYNSGSGRTYAELAAY